MSIWTNRNFKPMLLKEIDKPFDSKDYIFEIKLKQFIIEVNVTKSASGLNNEFFGPRFASLNEANKTAFGCYVTSPSLRAPFSSQIGGH